mgnify:CR=1 FL=1
MSESVSCAAPYCRRRVRPDYQFAPYCFDHRDMAKAQQTPVQVSAEERDLANYFKIPRAAAPITDTQRVSSALQSHFSLDEHTAYVISMTAQEMNMAYGDLTVPINADRVDPTEFMLALTRNGISDERLVLVTYRGYNAINDDARDYSEREMRYPHVTRNVVCLDQGTPQELVIDPSISSTALTRDRAIPIESDTKSFPSGKTPFADVPWVGTDQDYRNGSYLYWDSRSDDPDDIESMFSNS